MSAIGHLNGAKGTAPPAAPLEIVIWGVRLHKELLEVEAAAGHRRGPRAADPAAPGETPAPALPRRPVSLLGLLNILNIPQDPGRDLWQRTGARFRSFLSRADKWRPNDRCLGGLWSLQETRRDPYCSWA